jgi:hypothetical protein
MSAWLESDRRPQSFVRRFVPSRTHAAQQNESVADSRDETESGTSPRVRDLPRLMWVGTGLTSLLAAVGAYLLLVHWPSHAEKQ